MNKSSVSRWDWLSAALLFLLIQVAAARLVTTDWAPFLYFSETLAAFGTVIGLALGASQYKRRVVLWFVMDYTLALFPWQMTGALNKRLPFTDRFLNIGGVLLAALNQFLQRKPVQDSLFFVAFASLGFWLLALAAGYWLIRHRNLMAAILPTGILMLVIQAYDNFQPRSSWWIAVYILLALLLLGRQYYLNNQKELEKRRVFINDEAWTNIFSGLFTTVALAVIVAWTIPTSLQSLQAASDAWSGFTKPIRDRLSNAVTSLDAPYGSGGTNFYGDSLGLGRNAAVGDAQVFSVDILSSSAIPRYYWRGHVYDFYNNGQWLSTPASKFDFGPDSGNLNIPNEDNRSIALLQFTFQLPTQSLIYAPSQPVWVDRSSIVSASQVDPGVEDVLSWEARPAIQTGSQYQVRAKIASPTVEQLRAASDQYPEWIKNRYLEIPEAIRPDFQSLAEKITANQETPYDKAAAITYYLRANLQYETNLPAPPEGRDPLTWVLFTYKKGFCNYYASAEVMLLRSIGIPARLAVGFAQGEFVSGEYIVRRRDAHAWPEVYFPGIGWIEFEPTVSQDPLVRPQTIQNNGTNGAAPSPLLRPHEEDGQTASSPTSDSTTPQPADQLTQTISGRTFILILTTLVFAVLVYLIYRYRVFALLPAYLSNAFEHSGLTAPIWMQNWSRWNRLEPVERTFSVIDLSLRWLGQPQPIYSTPSERAALLKKLLPSASEHIEALKAELESGLFTPRPANLSRARRAGFLILLNTIRAVFRNFLGVNNEGDVYSR